MKSLRAAREGRLFSRPFGGQYGSPESLAKARGLFVILSEAEGSLRSAKLSGRLVQFRSGVA